jgi:xylan 1,4-beta-xylosidase
VSTIVICVKNNFERRIGIWPADFDKDDIFYSNSVFGDYPYYLPDKKEEGIHNAFTGWMLLNYNKPVIVSSTLGGYEPNYAVDENIKTYWSAATGNKGEWLQSDFGNVCTVRAIQINYADQDVDTSFLGKIPNLYHQYKLYSSDDGKNWQVLIDKSNNKTDVPHDYVELQQPVQSRYLKIENMHMPSGKFALSGFRVFGSGNGSKPDTVKNFIALRGNTERRNAWLKWQVNDNATGYNIYFGEAPGKLYNSVMIYGNNEYYLKALEKNKPYYFQIEAFNENGISQRTSVIKAE